MNTSHELMKASSNQNKAKEAASRFLAYLNEKTGQLHPHFQTKAQLEDLDEYFRKNWARIVEASCQRNGISSEELMSAVIDLL